MFLWSQNQKVLENMVIEFMTQIILNSRTLSVSGLKCKNIYGQMIWVLMR